MKKIAQVLVVSTLMGSMVIGGIMLMTGLGNFGVALGLFGIPFSIGLGVLATQ
jgi:hypothetical protein